MGSILFSLIPLEPEPAGFAKRKRILKLRLGRSWVEPRREAGPRGVALEFRWEGAELGLNALNSGQGAVLRPPRGPEELGHEFPGVEDLRGAASVRRHFLSPRCLADWPREENSGTGWWPRGVGDRGPGWLLPLRPCRGRTQRQQYGNGGGYGGRYGGAAETEP